MTDFDPFFERFAGQSTGPHEWQRELGEDDVLRTRVIRIPTGMGKTLGVLAAWAWHRLERQDQRWPRRLVWCLPMRVLVEQTEAVVRDALTREGVLWDSASDHVGKVGVHVLMGGADPGGDWNLFPEECAILIGTQDMLLSRALNRGYASGRARWPLEFGLLSHDTLWVMDEVQLMDVGLATSAQIQAFHDDDAPRGFRPRNTWWMSATLQPTWLKTVDTQHRHGDWVREPTTVSLSQRGKGVGAIGKRLCLASIGDQDSQGLAQRALDEHALLASGEYGRVTLVVCNTVKRACEAFDALRVLSPDQEVELVHSRFRPIERAGWRERFLSRAACTPTVNRIIVATQVVEAGVDISAGCVISDLAPWPSLVQRFGRCARYGGSGIALVVDRGREDEKAVAPYVGAELDAAWVALDKIINAGADVGVASLEAFEDALNEGERNALFPYQPKYLLLRRELDELFDTTPDLSGADIDISRFIRSGDERDVLVFWLDVAKSKKGARPSVPPASRRPIRDELCAVPFLRARDWLCGEESKTKRKPRLRERMRAWVWDWINGEWVVADRAMLTPGRVVCVAAECGGYRSERGFDSTSETSVVVVRPLPLKLETRAQLDADDSQDGEDLSAAQWKTIACHGGEVAKVAFEIAEATNLPKGIRDILSLAGLWHDLGKAHPAFQGAIRLTDRPRRQDLAKAPKEAWPRPPKTYRTVDDRDVRAGLRHELASALALFAVLQRHEPGHPALLGPWVEALELTNRKVPAAVSSGEPTPCERAVLACTADEFDLLAYLVACHHGKVRVALHAGPKDQDYRDRGDGRGMPIRGVREGDVLPSILLDADEAPLPSLILTLEPASLGLSSETGRSWRERTQALVARLGPGALAWLEALIIAADRRASRLTTTDPALMSNEEPPQ
jgi:CRISPR-associated endonuclease/helicase Cas3